MASAKKTEFNGHPAVALQSSDGARATILLHGAHLVSWVPAGGQEQIYLSPTSAYGEGQAVRGGVPVIFPQFSTRGTLPHDYTSAVAVDKERFNRFFHAMLDSGVYFAPALYEAGFVGAAHGPAEIEHTCKAARAAFAALA